MVQAIPATEITLRQLKQKFELSKSTDRSFFTEWLEPATQCVDAEKALHAVTLLLVELFLRLSHTC